METKIKDSGAREEMSTGSRRDTQDGKPRYELIPSTTMTKLAIHYANGLEKYGPNNWKKGQPIMRMLASANRHLEDWKLGLTDEPHLIACIWNLIAIDWTLDAIKAGLVDKELDDRGDDMKEGNPMGKIIVEIMASNVELMKSKGVSE